MHRLSRIFIGPSALLLCCSVFGSVRPAVAQADLTGYWDMCSPNQNGDGTFRDTYLQIQQSGESISGILIRQPHGISITGEYKYGVIHFVTQPPMPPAHPAGSTAATRPAELPIVFEGTYEAGKLLLTIRGRSGEMKSVGEKVSKEATMPPAPLPLPALKDLPDNGLAKTPPMGWNSWNKFAGKVNDASVREMADAMVSSGMRDAGYLYINIDDTWELGRDVNGNITSNRKFPDMKALADYVHSKGLKIGIYSSPGPKTCAGYEGSFGHEEQDAKTFAAWGIDYLKYDLCSGLDIYKDDAPTLQAIYQKMGQALEETHRPIVYSLCEYGRAAVWTGWGEKSSGNLWRTTGDISDRWDTMDKIGFSQLKLAAYAKPGHWNDPDMLEIGNGGMTADEYRTHMSLWSLFAAPMIAGNDLRTMNDETKSILMNREIIAIDQDPDYKPVTELSSAVGVEVLMRPLHDGSVVVGLFNRTGAPAEMQFARSSLPASLSGKTIKVRDLWKHDAASMSGEAFRATVPTHGVVMLRISNK